MPLLAALFSVMGVFGAYLVGVRLIGLDSGAFWGNMQAAIDFWPDVTNGIIKSFVFGIAVSLIAVFEGYDATPTAEGVSVGDDAHGGRRVARDPRARLRSYRVHVQRARRDESHRDRPVGRHFRRRSGSARSCSSRSRSATSTSLDTVPELSARRPLRQHRRPQECARRSRPRAWSSAASTGSGSTPRPTRPWSACKIDNGYQFTKDTIASILTSGLLGEVYIGLDAGGDTVDAGGRRDDCEDAIGGRARKLISQFLFDKASSGRGKVK